MLFIFHRDFGKWAWCIWRMRNQLISWAKTHNLHQTWVPGLEFWTWRNLACAAFRTYRSMNFSIFLGYLARPPGFSRIMDTWKLLAECILVWVLGHAGRILWSYLHDLCDHDIQTWYQGGRRLRIYFLRALFGYYYTQNCQIILFNSSQIPPDGNEISSALSGVYHRMMKSEILLFGNSWIFC
jgi:hypothetical protein